MHVFIKSSIRSLGCFSLLLGILLWGHVQSRAQSSALFEYHAGVYAEQVEGNLPKAISCYQKALRDSLQDRVLTARTLLRLGLCYKKSGHLPKAEQFFARIRAHYPDQIAIIEQLPQQTDQVHPLVRHYFERIGIDPFTALSCDGRMLARTDWSSGNLILKNMDRATEKTVTHLDITRSVEFAFHPCWSQDGQYLAYSRYRKHHFTELWIYSLAQDHHQMVFSNPQYYIEPQDWQPNGQSVLCLITDIEQGIHPRLVQISRNGTLQDLLQLDRNSRGLRYSPDGRFVAYDLLQDQDRHVFVLNMESCATVQISSGSHGIRGFDAPIWAPDGKLLLFRSFRLGHYDLWAVAMQDGRPAAEMVLLQSDLPKALLTLKGIRHSSQPPALREKSSRFEFADSAFYEDFASPKLSPKWGVFQWQQPNVYNYPNFGRYSLTDNPGHLRYYLDPISSQAYLWGYLPLFSGWYWFYPSLEFSRIFRGDTWQMETKITYFLPDGANGRGFDLVICFDADRDPETSLVIHRAKDIRPGSSTLLVQLLDRGVIKEINNQCLSPKDSLGVNSYTYVFRIARARDRIKVDLSDDLGDSFRTVLRGSLRSDLAGLPQLLLFTGDSWFVPAGSYADWDYVSLKFEP